MRTTCILMTLALNGFLAAGQSGQCCPYIGGVTIDPADPSEADTVRLFTTVTTPNIGSFIEHSFTVQNDTIFAEACYWEGMLTVPLTIHDTIGIGQLPAGDYVVRFTARQSSYSDQCVVNSFQVFDTSFSVGSIAGIADPEQAAIAVYPNPVSGLLHVSGEDISEIRLLNAEGRLLNAQITTLSPQLRTIDMRAFANGCYFVEIATGSTVRRYTFMNAAF